MKKSLKKPVIAVGPFHPLQEEMEFFQLTVDGETVTDIDVRISYNHRGIEKDNLQRPLKIILHPLPE